MPSMANAHRSGPDIGVEFSLAQLAVEASASAELPIRSPPHSPRKRNKPRPGGLQLRRAPQRSHCRRRARKKQDPPQRRAPPNALLPRNPPGKPQGRRAQEIGRESREKAPALKRVASRRRIVSVPVEATICDASRWRDITQRVRSRRPVVRIARERPRHSMTADTGTAPTAPKTVPKPRDQNLRDLADCIRFLSMDAVQKLRADIPARLWAWRISPWSCSRIS